MPAYSRPRCPTVACSATRPPSGAEPKAPRHESPTHTGDVARWFTEPTGGRQRGACVRAGLPLKTIVSHLPNDSFGTPNSEADGRFRVGASVREDSEYRPFTCILAQPSLTLRMTASMRTPSSSRRVLRRDGWHFMGPARRHVGYMGMGRVLQRCILNPRPECDERSRQCSDEPLIPCNVCSPCTACSRRARRLDKARLPTHPSVRDSPCWDPRPLRARRPVIMMLAFLVSPASGFACSAFRGGRLERSSGRGSRVLQVTRQARSPGVVPSNDAYASHALPPAAEAPLEHSVSSLSGWDRSQPHASSTSKASLVGCRPC